MSAHRVTLQQIAAATGFSANTVSRALRDSASISAPTRQLIRQKAQEMGYLPNYAATSLRLGQSHTLALIVETLTNPFFGMMFDHVDRAAAALGYSVILFCSRGTAEGEAQAIRSACLHGCDGILLISCCDGPESVLMLRALRVPFVLLVREVPGCEADAVLCDEAGGGAAAAEHLLAQGHRRLLYVPPRERHPSLNRRLEGFLSAAKGAGAVAREVVSVSADAAEDDRQAAAQIAQLYHAEGFTGVAAYCDMKAHALLAALSAGAGEPLPGLGLVGFDNIDAIAPSSVPLCSVSADYAAMCSAAAGLLEKRLTGDEQPPQHLLFPMAVVCRGRCGSGR